jgi:hypothetical protein
MSGARRDSIWQELRTSLTMIGRALRRNAALCGTGHLGYTAAPRRDKVPGSDR